jgi:hypothetical protein
MLTSYRTRCELATQIIGHELAARFCRAKRIPENMNCLYVFIFPSTLCKVNVESYRPSTCMEKNTPHKMFKT